MSKCDPWHAYQLQRRKAKYLKWRQLCVDHAMGRCKKGRMCRFAHCIQDVQPPPDTWTACPTHWWRPGLPIPEHLELIMKYISWSKDPLPKWAMQLQSKVGNPSQTKEAELNNEVVEAKISGPS